MAKKTKNQCPCGSSKDYKLCCGRYIDEGGIPETPEQLMRSRYTAYTMNNNSYLLATWHSSTRPVSLSAENELPVKWVELTIVRATDAKKDDTNAVVEFIARYKLNGKGEQMQEVSEFVREAGRWFYLNGLVT